MSLTLGENKTTMIDLLLDKNTAKKRQCIFSDYFICSSPEHCITGGPCRLASSQYGTQLIALQNKGSEPFS
jgi:hypothetical protein